MLQRLIKRPRPAGWAGGPLFIGVLGLLMAFAPMSVDMYLPALPAIGVEFGASQAAVQASLSAFFLGFGAGQLFWGPIGDWLGRRGPSAAGILLYGVGSIGCVLATGIDQLAVWRFVQALGACAAPVLARAMVRDVYEHDRAAAALSLMMLVMGAAPMLAPVIGGQIIAVSSWRTIFLVLTAFGVAGLIGIAVIPETLDPGNRRRADWIGMVRGYGILLADRNWLGYSLCGAFMFAGMFAYISGTPFIYIGIFGVRPENYGFLFGLNVIGMMLLSAVNGRAVLRIGSDRVLRIACIAAAVFGALLLAVSLTGFGGLAGIVAAVFLFVSMMGVIGANAMAGALSAFPTMAGSASALAGTLQFAFGAVSGWLVNALADGTAVPMAVVICATGMLCAASNLAMVRKS